MATKSQTQWLDRRAAHVLPPIVDTSCFALADTAMLGTVQSDSKTKAPPAGWPASISADALKTYSGLDSDECYPFVVGGAATGSAGGYECLLLLKAAQAAWTSLAEGAIAGGDAVAIFADVKTSTERCILPEKSAAAVVHAHLQHMIDHAVHAQTTVLSPSFTPQKGAPGCLKENPLINAPKVFAALLGAHIIQAHSVLTGATPTEANYADAFGWYTETKTAKEAIKTGLTLDNDAEAAYSGVKELVDAAKRLAGSNIQESAAASDAIKLWRGE
jgi:hypothetical protein